MVKLLTINSKEEKLVDKILTWAEYDLIDDTYNPDREVLLKAFENLNAFNTEMYLIFDQKTLRIIIDNSETRYVVSIGSAITGKRLVDPILIDQEEGVAMKALKFFAHNGEAESCYYKQSVNKQEALRVLLYFFQYGKLPDDVMLFTYK